jgi:phage-related protein
VANWKLEFFETARGDRPVAEYLEGLPLEERAKMIRGLDRLAEFGTALTMPEVRRMKGSDLWELRIRGCNHHRVFYVVVIGRQILLLHAFAKRSQRTPKRELQTAETRLREYRGRT